MITGLKHTEVRKASGPGYLYVITNPAWPSYCKVGRSFDPEERVRGFQTASPKRDYVLHYKRHFPDVLSADRDLKEITKGFNIQRTGEWVMIHPDDAVELIRSLEIE